MIVDYKGKRTFSGRRVFHTPRKLFMDLPNDVRTSYIQIMAQVKERLPEAVGYVFGSHAMRSENAGSDYDLFIEYDKIKAKDTVFLNKLKKNNPAFDIHWGRKCQMPGKIEIK